MESTQYTVRVDNIMSTPFTVDICLKQVDAMSLILFNLVIEKVVRELQYLRNRKSGLRLFGFADDLNIIGNSLTDIANASRKLKKAVFKAV